MPDKNKMPSVLSATSEKKTVGVTLKEARLKQKKEIKTAANKLCIRKIYLEALENDTSNMLPGQTYTIGFLKSYAAYLKLNPEKIVETYLLENPSPKEISRSGSDDTVPLYENTKYIQMQYVLYILFGILIIFASYGLFSLFSGANQDVSESEERVVPLVVDEVLEPVVLSDESPELSSSVSDSEGTSSLKPEELKSVPSSAEITTDKIVLRADEDTWIELLNRKTGNVIFSRILKQGETYEMKEDVHVSLTVGNAGGLSVYVLGKDVGKFGPKGVRRSHIRMDAESIESRIEK
ncbi:MAG: DUF4115 domain-containing protein [Alphaproteobacteria bacterium]|nr:DUF4115 domain-containing protein [Alphaproteobacteria bacterium]MBN2780152.1 DUF4115 domain-containing protein [Alphaproteobacteria bacterium]